MVSLNKNKLAVLVAAMTIFFSYASHADEMPAEEPVDYSKMTPDATVTIEEESVKLIIGGTYGDGVLSYKGQEYPFKASSLSISHGAGVSKIHVTGKVYNLKDIADFNGTFLGVEAAAQVLVGAGYAQVQNDKGVVMILEGKSEGVAIELDAGFSRLVVER